ncbi:MAG: hypothetical protein A2172_00020 [Candidatus Woykebacteria bacterium RBG_13_40_15]|uniref:Uncharacterized protein n=1 Tax=Candidatus Woykebacteria bacterium RBG_13_40_15 TaxID=1802593 RepID=A0A1G1W7F9_9BACT|nr:MAG: hypothetical protein A2172_00020 [Candidatus Woykebacteria bacterium RBG_13_40_15]
MKTLLIYVFIDVLSLLFAITISIFSGNQFQPNPFTFILTYLPTRLLIYYVWLKKVQKKGFLWQRLALQSILIILLLPIFIAIIAFIFPGIPNNVFWFIAVPVVGVLISLFIHNYFFVGKLKKSILRIPLFKNKTKTNLKKI